MCKIKRLTKIRINFRDFRLENKSNYALDVYHDKSLTIVGPQVFSFL